MTTHNQPTTHTTRKGQPIMNRITTTLAAAAATLLFAAALPAMADTTPEPAPSRPATCPDAPAPCAGVEDEYINVGKPADDVDPDGRPFVCPPAPAVCGIDGFEDAPGVVVSPEKAVVAQDDGNDAGTPEVAPSVKVVRPNLPHAGN